MRRTLMQLGVGDLEALFAKSRTDVKVLKQLEHELQYRQVPRAVALLEEVQAAMYGASSATAPAPAASPAAPQASQPDLWERPLPAVETSAPAPQRSPVVNVTPAISVASVAATPPAAPAMTLEEAHKVLKVSLGATWESIEQTRRQLVQQSHPERMASLTPERRAQALKDAKRVNAAYAVLTAAMAR